MAFLLCKTLSFLLVATILHSPNVLCQTYLYGVILDLEESQTSARIYKMEIKKNLPQFPLKQVEDKTCPLKLTLPDDTAPIVKEFQDCIDKVKTGELTKIDPPKIYPVITGSEYLNNLRKHSNDKVVKLMGAFEKFLKSKKYAFTKNNYYQPLEANDQIIFLSLAAGYNDMEEDIASLNSALSMDSYHLHFVHPIEDPMKAHKLFKAVTVDSFKKKFDMLATQLDCYGNTELQHKYVYTLVKEQFDPAKQDAYDSPCHPAQNVEYHLKDVKNDCNKDLFLDTFPDKVTIMGQPDDDGCTASLKKVFCIGFPKDYPCPFEANKPNIFLPEKKDVSFNIGDPFSSLQQKYSAKDGPDLITKIKAACLTPNSAQLDLKTIDCFHEVYSVFVFSQFSHDWSHNTIIPAKKTWHLGKMLKHSRDIKTAIDKAKKKRSVITGVMVTLVLLAIIIIVGVIYITKFKK